MNNYFGFDYSKNFLKNQKTKIKNLSILNFLKITFFFFLVLLYLPYFLFLHVLQNGIKNNKEKPKNYKYGFHVNNNIYDRSKFSKKNFF